MLDWQRMLLVVSVLGVLILLLRWAYGGGRSSLVERRATVGHSNQYGLLVAISAPGTYIEGELSCRLLTDAGVRATLVTTVEGPRVMVFPEDESLARQVLAAG